MENKIICGDCRDVMLDLPEESIHMIIFSPPFYGLRDYGDIETVWGGDEDCEHEFYKVNKKSTGGGSHLERSTYDDGVGRGPRPGKTESNFCQKCGAWKGQFGLEPSFRDYINHLVEVFREIKRVLRPDGSVYLNLGDTYSGGGGNKGVPDNWESKSNDNRGKYSYNKPSTHTSVESKCKILIPHRVAIALIDDGWIVRNDIIWKKGNPMPSSVKDRLNTTFEYIFHLTKNKRYWYDLDAIREPLAESTLNDMRIDCKTSRKNSKSHKLIKKGTHGSGGIGDPNVSRRDINNINGKNPGDVFEVNTKPFSAAHFAVYPPELVKKPIKSSCPRKVCAECGTPYEREIETPDREYERGNEEWRNGANEQPQRDHGDWGYEGKFKGWKKQCDCDTDETEPGIVLDPFAGAGTTCMVAEELDRRYIGIEISEEYAELARERIEYGDKYIRKQVKKERQKEKHMEENHSILEFLEDSDEP